MGILLPNFKKAVIDDIRYAIESNTSYYYAFASNPVDYGNTTPENTQDDYSSTFEFDWTMLFGKKLSNTNFLPVIRNITWQTNTIFDRYDNTEDLSNSDFYAVVTPDDIGGYYQVYKCIDNANGIASNTKPSLVQLDSFQTADNYIWRYMYSIPSAIYNRFATNDYVPVYPNTTVTSNAYTYSGVEVVMISNSGTGYSSYFDGTIRSISNSTVLQIDNDASDDNNFYTNNSIYIYNLTDLPAQLKTITNYVSNNTGNWVYLDTAANTDNIVAGTSSFKISPRLVFDTNGNSTPLAYTTINTSANSILSVVVIDAGYGITRANVSVVSNSTFGTGANLYCIVPPAGGHGNNPENELYVTGLGIYFEFSSSESNTIPINTLYNKIGIIKNPYSLDSNNQKSDAFTSNTFDQLFKANVSPSATFTEGETVTGNTSDAKGVVVYSNSTQLYMTGDRNFSNGEYVVSSNGSLQTVITINTLGDLFTKEIVPIYVRNIDDVERANGQIEAFNIILQV